MQISLDKIQVHDELDPELWDDFFIRSNIRKSLLRIAAEFLINLGVDALPTDITLTGSTANFNYTSQSDIDLHVVFDFISIDEDIKLVREMLMAKKSLWNLRHDIKIKNHPVEIYPQDINDAHHSTGVYSLLNNIWIVRPEIDDAAIDVAAVEEKVQAWVKIIEDVLGRRDRLMYVVPLREKLANMRKIGLSEMGENSVENLTFKVLRRTGHLDRLAQAQQEDRDAALSIAQEGYIVKISRGELMKVLREELSEFENPRHRGGSHERTKPVDEFDPPDDLLLAADTDEDEDVDEIEEEAP